MAIELFYVVITLVLDFVILTCYAWQFCFVFCFSFLFLPFTSLLLLINCISKFTKLAH